MPNVPNVPRGRGLRCRGWGPAVAALGLAVAVGAAGAAATARAADAAGTRVPLPPPSSPDWQPVVFRGIERHTVYTPASGGDAVRARADCSASARVLRLDPPPDLARTPRLRWRWRVLRGLDVADETRREGDDFAARVYVLFPPDPARLSFWDRLRRHLAERLYEQALPGAALDYVWASRVPVGRSWPNPYAPENVMVALRSDSAAAAEAWREETVDLVADQRRWLSSPLRAPSALAIMTDADQTCTRAEAEYAGFALLGPGN